MTYANPRVLLAQALQHIIDHPELWDQQEFHCGTARCLIGHMAELHPDFRMWDSNSDTDLLIGGRWQNVEEWASEFLDIEFGDLAALAHPKNTLQQLKAGVRAYLYGADIQKAVYGAA